PAGPLRSVREHRCEAIHDRLRLFACGTPFLLGTKEVLADLDQSTQVGLELALGKGFVAPAADLLEGEILQPFNEGGVEHPVDARGTSGPGRVGHLRTSKGKRSRDYRPSPPQPREAI